MGLGLPNHSLTGRSLQRTVGLGLPNHSLRGRSLQRTVGLGLPNHSLTGRTLQRTGGAWITKPFTTWKMVTQKLKSYSKSEGYLLSYQLDVEADRARKEGSLSASFKMLESSKDYKIGGD